MPFAPYEAIDNSARPRLWFELNVSKSVAIEGGLGGKDCAWRKVVSSPSPSMPN